MDVTDAIVEVVKILGPIAIAYIGVLKNRSDIDRYAASQRAKDSGRPYETQIRKRWYQGLFKKRMKRPAEPDQGYNESSPGDVPPKE